VIEGALGPTQLVGVGGALGAVARHLVYLRLDGGRFPAATLAVNVLGSLAFGLLLFAEVGESATYLAGVGFCGAFTTFSTFSVETVGLWERGERRTAVLSAGANLALSLSAIGLAGLVLSVVG